MLLWVQQGQHNRLAAIAIRISCIRVGRRDECSHVLFKFTREGEHLYCEVPVSFVDAALGGDLEVPTLEGRVNLKIPAETQTGKLFRLRGKGVNVTQVRGGGVGDLYCRITVETPVNLSRRQKELLREFAGETSAKQSPRQTSWFDSVKQFIDSLTD